MAMPIVALSAQAGLATRPLRQGRIDAAAIGPQRRGPAAYDGDSRQSRVQIAPQPLPSPVPTPSIRVEYQQDRPILMLHDHAGVLIYQVPSKGALRLIQQEDAPGWSLSERV